VSDPLSRASARGHHQGMPLHKPMHAAHFLEHNKEVRDDFRGYGPPTQHIS